MQSTIWDIIENYKQNNIKPDKKSLGDYYKIHEIISAKMFGPDVQNEDLFSRFVGADDGHYDLIDYIIWNGKEVTENFLNDPKTAIPLARIMSKDPNFDGDVNILQRML